MTDRMRRWIVGLLLLVALGAGLVALYEGLTAIVEGGETVAVVAVPEVVDEGRPVALDPTPPPAFAPTPVDQASAEIIPNEAAPDPAMPEPAPAIAPPAIVPPAATTPAPPWPVFKARGGSRNGSRSPRAATAKPAIPPRDLVTRALGGAS